MFMLAVRWPGGPGETEHLVEANKYVELQILEAEQLGMESGGLRIRAERAFDEAANARSSTNTIQCADPA